MLQAYIYRIRYGNAIPDFHIVVFADDTKEAETYLEKWYGTESKKTLIDSGQVSKGQRVFSISPISMD